MKCYQADCPAPRGAFAAIALSSSAVPTLERLNTAALRETVITFRDTSVSMHTGSTGSTSTRCPTATPAPTWPARSMPWSPRWTLLPTTTTHATCDAISHGSLMGARGNSGVILSQILRGFAGTVKEHADAQGAKVAEALQAAAAGAYEAVLKPIEGTILTVCRESAEAAKVAADAGGSLVEVRERPARRASSPSTTPPSCSRC